MRRIVGILVIYNRVDIAVRTFSAISSQTRTLAKLYVVDNSTIDTDTEGRCRELWPHSRATLEWIRPNRNLGPAGAYALGMEKALLEFGNRTCTWIALFDDDDPPPSIHILAELATIQEDSRIAAVGVLGSVVSRRTGRLHRPEFGARRFEDVDQIGNGRIPIYKLDAISSAGPMRSDLFFGREELEFGLRLKAAGYRLVIDQKLRSKYEEQMGKLPRSPSLSLLLEQTELHQRTLANHIQILVTYVGYFAAIAFSVGKVCAELSRLLRSLRSGAQGRRIASSNVRQTFRTVTGAIKCGRLSPVE